MGNVREKKKASTKEALLKAGANLFAEKGYERTTVEDISEKAVVSKFTFYKYFESKEELLHVLHHDRLSQAISSTAKMLDEGTNVAFAMETLVASIALWYTQNQELARVILGQGGLAMLRDDPDGCLHDFIALIETGQKSGEFNKSRSAKDAAMYIYLMVYGEKMAWIKSNCSYSFEDKLKSAMDFWIQGMKPCT